MDGKQRAADPSANGVSEELDCPSQQKYAVILWYYSVMSEGLLIIVFICFYESLFPALNIKIKVIVSFYLHNFFFIIVILHLWILTLQFWVSKTKNNQKMFSSVSSDPTIVCFPLFRIHILSDSDCFWVYIPQICLYVEQNSEFFFFFTQVFYTNSFVFYIYFTKFCFPQLWIFVLFWLSPQCLP